MGIHICSPPIPSHPIPQHLCLLSKAQAQEHSGMLSTASPSCRNPTLPRIGSFHPPKKKKKLGSPRAAGAVSWPGALRVS